MMILLPEYATNCCLLACSRCLGSGTLSSDVGSKLNNIVRRKNKKRLGLLCFFFLVNFSPVLYYLNTWNRLASYKPWAYTSLKGVLGGLYPRGLKIRRNFLLIGRWGYKWVGVIIKWGAGLTMYKQQFMIWQNNCIGKVKTVEVELRSESG